MNVRIFGAVLVVFSCSGVGLILAAESKREERSLRMFLHAVDTISCELQYRLSSLPELCALASDSTGGSVRDVFHALEETLDVQSLPDAASCMNDVLKNQKKVSPRMKDLFRQLGQALGKYDLPGQISSLESVKAACCRQIESYEFNRENRLRCYQTISLCAGAALAILLI